jgi:hypothetical protein
MRAGKCPFEISHLTVDAHCYDATEQFFRQTAPFVVPTRNETDGVSVGLGWRLNDLKFSEKFGFMNDCA